jgi:hypothetical protein
MTASAASAASIQLQGLKLTLPAGWSATGKTATAKFNASGGAGHLAVTAGGTFPTGVPFALFVRTEGAAAKKAYLQEDAHAVVSSAKKVTLPSGPAVMMTATVHHGGAPVSIVLYSLLHNGVTYHFTFFTNSASSAGERGDFASIAKSINFS